MIINKGCSEIMRIAVLVFSYYPIDPRVRRETEALVEAGMSVDLICLRRDTEPRKEIVNGVSVNRLPLKRKPAGRLRIIWEFFYFIMMSFFRLSLLHLRNWYKLVHVHNMPDILVFCALIPRLTGAKVILDLHDPMPEVYMSKYTINDLHPVVRLLRILEKYSIRFSNLVLTPTIACRKLFISRGCPQDKIHIIMNSPMKSIFRKSNKKKNKSTGNKDRFHIMYHGTFVDRNGLDVALMAINNLREIIPNLEFHAYGEGESVGRFKELLGKLDLRNIVTYHYHVPQTTIAEAIESIDVGIIPNRQDPFTELNLPTRIFEYLSMGKPVIAPKTKGILDYFDEESLLFFEPGNADSLADVIFEVYNNPSKSQAVLNRGINNYQKHPWELEKKKLIDLVTDLLRTNVNNSTHKINSDKK